MGEIIDVDSVLLAEAVEASGLGSAQATVEEALKRLIADDKHRRALQSLAGIGWEGDLDAMREGREDHKRR